MNAVLSFLTGKNWRWFVLAFVVSAVVTYAWFDGMDYGKDSANTQWQAKWAERDAQDAEARALAEQAARNQEHEWQNAIEVIRNETKNQIEQARADAAAADAAAVGLHEQARRLAARSSQCASSSTTADRSAAARATNAVVLAELFERADRTAGQLAAAYDRARAAGLACERAYDGLRHNAKAVP